MSPEPDMSRRKPTRADLLAAVDLTVPDLIASDLKVLFCGINPGLYSAWAGHHFARPGNRFWPTLYRAGFTDRLLSPYEEHLLLESGYGITNIANRTSARADELTKEELADGARLLTTKVLRYRPRTVAVLGVSAYRTAFERPKAVIGRQEESIGESTRWQKYSGR